VKEKTWYCLLSRRNPGNEEQPLLALKEHLLYVRKLHDEGKLYASGPVPGVVEGPPGDGFHILNVSSRKEAEEIAAADPFHRRGIRTYEIWPWKVHWLGEERLGIPQRILELAGLEPAFGKPGRRNR